ncbi:MAG TPA: hypothetical protein DCO82_04550 [Alphaproteobacteria bacterium]|nr:hypothetical protein [Alphaproteobacteria bacterium]
MGGLVMTGHEQEYGGVGRDLRRARQACGQEISSAAQVLRINSSHLRALEEGRFGDLPAAVYVRGYVRAYADYLHLDADEMLRRVHQEHYAEVENEELNFPAAPDELRPPGSGILLYALAIAALVISGWYYLHGAEEAASPQIAKPPELDSVLPAVPVSPENPSGPSEPSAISSQTSPDERAPVAPLIPSIEELLKSDGGMEPEASGSITGEAIPEQQRDTADLPPSPPLIASPGGVIAQASPSGAPASPVLLRATADTWMQLIRPDGTEVKSWVMRAGEEYVPPGEEGLSLTIGNAAALRLFLDGAEQSPLGERGAVIRGLPLDAAILRERFKP